MIFSSSVLRLNKDKNENKLEIVFRNMKFNDPKKKLNKNREEKKKKRERKRENEVIIALHCVV